MKLKNKVAIITGSTSGMGRATALLFAREGAKVVVVGRNEKRAKEVVDEIKKEGSPLKKFGQPEEIATAALFLATEDSSFVTGQLLRVDGGIDI